MSSFVANFELDLVATSKVTTTTTIRSVTTVATTVMIRELLSLLEILRVDLPQFLRLEKH